MRSDQEILDMLEMANVGKTYRPKEVKVYNSDLGEWGDALQNMIVDNSLEDNLDSGEGFWITGFDSRKAAHLLTKVAVLLGFDAKVVGLGQMILDLEENGDFGYYRAEFLAITEFYERGVGCPFTDRERIIMENWLRQRVDNEKPTVFAMQSPRIDSEFWWSPSFRELALANTITVNL